MGSISRTALIGLAGFAVGVLKWALDVDTLPEVDPETVAAFMGAVMVIMRGVTSAPVKFWLFKERG